MASPNRKLSYQKLKSEASFDESDDELYNLREKVIGKVGRGSSRFRRFHIRKKLKIKIPCFKRLFSRKVKMVTFAWRKVLKRLKESQSHFGDLFAGNYLFTQVIPTPLKAFSQKSLKGVEDFSGLSSRNSVPIVG
ncbi:hypothetical protein Leryth_013316 [Lithospermum erythrorhizon]|uniref:Uncharacterized protein n=1 Tax=Lithospermum erythrorhizon TaxID=34254 RepID=A0AAV3PT79_LITER|nr:hypothetical protein Leryth_013316 [Lithospermum erythrorhizon]